MIRRFRLRKDSKTPSLSLSIGTTGCRSVSYLRALFYVKSLEVKFSLVFDFSTFKRFELFVKVSFQAFKLLPCHMYVAIRTLSFYDYAWTTLQSSFKYAFGIPSHCNESLWHNFKFSILQSEPSRNILMLLQPPSAFNQISTRSRFFVTKKYAMHSNVRNIIWSMGEERSVDEISPEAREILDSLRNMEWGLITNNYYDIRNALCRLDKPNIRDDDWNSLWTLRHKTRVA